MSTSTTSGYQDQPMNLGIRKVSVIKYSIRGMKAPRSTRAPPKIYISAPWVYRVSTTTAVTSSPKKPVTGNAKLRNHPP